MKERHSFEAQPAQEKVEGEMEGLPQAEAVVVLCHEIEPGRKGEVVPSMESKMRALGAFELWRRGLVDSVIISGGPWKDFGEDRSSAQVVGEYIAKKGVDPKDLILETKSKNTAENLENVLDFLEAKGIKSALIETNEYHLGRARQLLENILEKRGLKIEIATIAAEKILKERSRHYKNFVSHYELPTSLTKSTMAALNKGLREVIRRIMIYVDKNDNIAKFLARRFH